MNENPNRRELLKAGALAGAVGLTFGPSSFLGRARASLAQPRDSVPIHSGPKRSLRLAHITDMHIQPERNAFVGVGQCLRHLQAMPDKPGLILTGGDLIMDAFEHDATRTTALWDLWTRTLNDNCSLPVEHCLGNHDIWGWNKKKSATTGQEARWGKRWALDVLGIEKPYRTFDKAGWRFVVLDTVFPNGDGYIGKLDDEQFAWLEGVLKDTPTSMPVLVLGHIPILTITAITSPKEDVVTKHEGSISEMMSDMPRIVKLFDKHRNVKVCLSGHIHEIDKVEYQGVTYLCDGAVSGAWWKGRHHDCDEGYAVIDLFDDGSVARTYQTYGWVAAKE